MPAASSGGGVAGEEKRAKAAAGLGAARVAPRGSDASVVGFLFLAAITILVPMKLALEFSQHQLLTNQDL
jgi:hypothetical protein